MIRQAVVADAEAIGRIRVAAWQSAYTDFLPTDYLAALDPSANLDGLRHAIHRQSRDFTVLIAEQDQNPVGFAIVGKPRSNASNQTLELYAINVDPIFWGKGHGKSLVRSALELAPSYDATEMFLWCIKGNTTAYKVYEACGFHLSGETEITSELTGHPLEQVKFQRKLFS